MNEFKGIFSSPSSLLPLIVLPYYFVPALNEITYEKKANTKPNERDVCLPFNKFAHGEPAYIFILI
jgi:hypothetical protein